jgi:hypothetical protein
MSVNLHLISTQISTIHFCGTTLSYVVYAFLSVCEMVMFLCCLAHCGGIGLRHVDSMMGEQRWGCSA